MPETDTTTETRPADKGNLDATAANMVDALLPILLRSRAQKPVEPLNVRPPMDQQAARLREIGRSYVQESTFKPGDMVRLKDGLGVINDTSRPTLMMMYWRALDHNDYQDRLLVKRQAKRLIQDRVDCLVAHVCDDGHCLVKMAMDSNELEHWTPPVAG